MATDRFDLLANARDDAAFGDVDGTQAHRERFGGFLAILVLHRGVPESVPSLLREFTFHFVGGPLEHSFLVGQVPDFGFLGVGSLFELRMDGGASGSLGLFLKLCEKLEEFVSRDREKPSSEGALAPIVVKALDGLCDGLHHLLSDIGGVGVLEASLFAKGEHQRRVESHELLPSGAVVGVPYFEQEGWLSNGNLAHGFRFSGL